MAHIDRLRSEGVTIVLVTHNSQLVRQMCDSAAWLDHGRILEMGDPNRVVPAYLDHVESRGDNTLTTRD